MWRSKHLTVICLSAIDSHWDITKARNETGIVRKDKIWVTDFPTHQINYVKLATCVSQLHIITVQVPTSGQNLLCGLGPNLAALSKITLKRWPAKLCRISSHNTHTYLCGLYWRSKRFIFSAHFLYYILGFPVFPGRFYRLLEDLFTALKIPRRWNLIEKGSDF